MRFLLAAHTGRVDSGEEELLQLRKLLQLLSPTGFTLVVVTLWPLTSVATICYHSCHGGIPWWLLSSSYCHLSHTCCLSLLSYTPAFYHSHRCWRCCDNKSAFKVLDHFHQEWLFNKGTQLALVSMKDGKVLKRAGKGTGGSVGGYMKILECLNELMILRIRRRLNVPVKDCAVWIVLTKRLFLRVSISPLLNRICDCHWTYWLHWYPLW